MVKFQAPSRNTSRDKNYFLPCSPDYKQTESNAYQPIVQLAQVGSKIKFFCGMFDRAKKKKKKKKDMRKNCFHVFRNALSHNV